MRTTVTLDDELLQEAKEAAVRSGRTLSEVVGDALREMLRRRTGRPQYHVQLITAGHGGRVVPGVDFSDNAAVRTAMEEEWDQRQLSAGGNVEAD